MGARLVCHEENGRVCAGNASENANVIANVNVTARAMVDVLHFHLAVGEKASEICVSRFPYEAVWVTVTGDSGGQA